MAKNSKFKKVVATAVTGAVIFGSGTAVGALVNRHNEDKHPKEKEYTVQAGDTLYDLSDRFYGSGVYYDEIADRNHIKNPDEIKEGDVVVLPAEVSEGVYLNTVQTYTVQPGDNLTTICEKFYNDSSYETVSKLANFNDIKNMDFINQGQTIHLPLYEDLLEVNIRSK